MLCITVQTIWLGMVELEQLLICKGTLASVLVQVRYTVSPTKIESVGDIFTEEMSGSRVIFPGATSIIKIAAMK